MLEGNEGSKLWGSDVLRTYNRDWNENNENDTLPDYVTNVGRYRDMFYYKEDRDGEIIKSIAKVNVYINLINLINPKEKYDAYKDDIAMLNIFFGEESTLG